MLPNTKWQKVKLLCAIIITCMVEMVEWFIKFTIQSLARSFVKHPVSLKLESMFLGYRNKFFIYIYIYIYMCVCVCVCVFWQHFFINTYFIKYNRHFLSTYFCVNPFVLPYWSNDIRRELVNVSSIISWAKSTWKITNYGRFINQFPPNIIRSMQQFERINKKYVDKKVSIIFIHIYIYIYIYIYKKAMLIDM